MNIEKAFEILGIDITDNKKSIKSAYRKKLVDANPEDKPEEFKILREAYDYAIKNLLVIDRFVDLNINKVSDDELDISEENVEENKENLDDVNIESPDTDEQLISKSEIGLFLDKVKNLYDDINVRFDVREWKNLLSDPICCALDSYEDVRGVMIYFLIDNCILNKPVWNLIDKTFSITKDREELIEKYSDEFINQIINRINDYNEYYFELLKYTVDDTSSANPDLYLYNYIDLVKYGKKLEKEIGYGEAIGEIKRNEFLKVINDFLDVMNSCGVYHPFEEVYKLKIFTILGDKEKQDILCQKVIDVKNKYDISEKENLLLDYQISISYLNRDEEERAFDIWKKIENVDPFNVDVNYALVKYYIKKELYFEARKNLSKILDWINVNDKSITDIKNAINTNLFGPLYDCISNHTGYEYLTYEETIFELCLCYIELDMTYKADDILRHNKNDLSKLDYEFNFVNGIVLLTKRKYNDALKSFLVLKDIVGNIVDDSEKNKMILLKHAYIEYCLAEIYFNLIEIEKMTKSFNDAVKFSTTIEERYVIQNRQIEYYKQLKMYEEAIDVCKELIEYNYKKELVYINLQKIYFANKQYYDVLDNYFMNENLSNNKEWYIYAAESCIKIRRDVLALRIIDKAKNNGIKHSVRMILDEYRCNARLSKTSTEREKIYNSLKEIYDSYKKNTQYEWDIDDLSDVTFLMWETIAYVDEEEANKVIEETFRINPNNGEHRFVYAKHLINKYFYKKAIEQLLALPEDYQEDVDVLLWFARCYRCLRQDDKALEYYLEVLEKKRVYYEASRWVALYYKQKYTEDKNCYDNYTKAVDYISRQTDNTVESYNYLVRAEIYMEGLEYSKAIVDAEKCLEFSESSYALSVIGRCYEKLGEYDKALEYFNKIKFYKLDDEDIITYVSMSACLLAKGEFKKALNLLNKIKNQFEVERVNRNPSDLMKQTKSTMTKMFLQMQRFDEKLIIGELIYEQLGHTYELLNNNLEALNNYELCSNRYINSIFDVYYKAANVEKGYAYFDYYINSKSDLQLRFNAYVDKINIIIMQFANYSLAMNVIDDALNRIYNYEHIFILMGLKIKTYLLMKDYNSASTYANNALKHFSEKVGIEKEIYLSDRLMFNIRNITFGYIELAQGNTDNAIEILQNVYDKNKKIKRKNKNCSIPSLELACAYLIANDKEKSKEYFEKALDFYPVNNEVNKGLELLEEPVDKESINEQVEDINHNKTVSIESESSIEKPDNKIGVLKTRGESRMMQLLRNKEKNNGNRN